MRQMKKQQSHSDDLWQWADRKESSAHPQPEMKDDIMDVDPMPHRGIQRISSWYRLLRRKVLSFKHKPANGAIRT